MEEMGEGGRGVDGHGVGGRMVVGLDGKGMGRGGDQRWVQIRSGQLCVALSSGIFLSEWR
jgi:hypothetical protein